MPCKSFHCSVCDRDIAFRKGTRLEAQRRHYKRHHPQKFKQSTKKAVKHRKG
jgi:hypothetical protein